MILTMNWIPKLFTIILALPSWTKGKCVPDPREGLQLTYANYKDECVVHGYSSYLQQQRHTDTLNNVTSAYDCLLCDQRQYLFCFEIGGHMGESSHPEVVKHSHDQIDLGGPIGECDCLDKHSKGYMFVYDEKNKQCRGGINSVCDRGVECHSDLKCQMGTCMCMNNETGCPSVPNPRGADDSSAADTVHAVGVNSVFDILKIPVLICLGLMMILYTVK